MSMFPGSHATVFRNEAGEPLGWSDESSSGPPICDICGGDGHLAEDCYDDSDELETDESSYDDMLQPGGYLLEEEL